MLPTVFNELLMGINVRILNEILSLALYMYISMKKIKTIRWRRSFFWCGGLSRRAQYVGNKFLQHGLQMLF